MTQREAKRIGDAIDCLADATDTLTGGKRERERVGQIMQELSDIAGSQVDIEECLAESATAH